jgi:hypothetical protein
MDNVRLGKTGLKISRLAPGMHELRESHHPQRAHLGPR